MTGIPNQYDTSKSLNISA